MGLFAYEFIGNVFVLFFSLMGKKRVDGEKFLTDIMYNFYWYYLVCEKVESKGRTTYNEVR